MNAHSSQLHAAGAGTQRFLPSPRGNATGLRSGDAPFASHLETDHVPPAQAARTALEDRPDLADRPFGAIVSLLARHEELPAAADTAAADTAATDTAAADTAATVPSQDNDGTAQAEGGNADTVTSA